MPTNAISYMLYKVQSPCFKASFANVIYIILLVLAPILPHETDDSSIDPTSPPSLGLQKSRLSFRILSSKPERASHFHVYGSLRCFLPLRNGRYRPLRTSCNTQPRHLWRLHPRGSMVSLFPILYRQSPFLDRTTSSLSDRFFQQKVLRRRRSCGLEG